MHTYNEQEFPTMSLLLAHLNNTENFIREGERQLAAEKAKAAPNTAHIESIEEFLADAKASAANARQLLGMACSNCGTALPEPPGAPGPTLCTPCNDKFEAEPVVAEPVVIDLMQALKDSLARAKNNA